MKKLLLSCALMAFVSSPAQASGIEAARRGLELSQQGFYEESLLQFKEALAQKDMDTTQRAKTYYNIGTTQLAFNRANMALASFQQALALDPKNVDFLINRSEAYRQIGRYQEALEDAQAALKVDGNNNIVAHYQSGLLYADRGNNKQALESFKKAVSGDRANLDYKMGYAQALLKAKSYQKAVDEFTDVIEKDPWRAKAYLYRSVGWEGLKKIDRARADLTVAAEIAPNDPAVRSIYKDMRFPARKRDLRKIANPMESLAAPRERAPVVRPLAKGQEIEVLDCAETGWCRINVNSSFVGYVLKDKIRAQK